MIWVCGAYFSPNREKIALIRKNRPDWQKGSYNLIGGKLERQETPQEAMAREFEEETSFKTLPSDWAGFLTLYVDGNTVHFLRNFGPIDQIKTMTDEKVEIFYTDCLPSNTIDNLGWIVPLALYSDRIYPFNVWYKPKEGRIK